MHNNYETQPKVIDLLPIINLHSIYFSFKEVFFNRFHQLSKESKIYLNLFDTQTVYV